MDSGISKGQAAPGDGLMNIEVLDRIRDRLTDFTPVQRVLAEYLLLTPEALLFMSINELAAEAGVSQATIVRFSNTLGYTGFAALAREARQVMQGQISSVGRFQLVRSARREGASGEMAQQGASAFGRILNHELDNLRKLGESIRADDFNRAVDMLLTARRVLVIGCMSSASLADLFGRTLSKILPEVDVIDGEGVLRSSCLSRLDRDSVVFVLCYSRYPAATDRLARAAAAAGARLVVVTDNHSSPLSGRYELTFHVETGISSFLDSQAAPLTFLNALCAEAAERNPELAEKALARYDRWAVDNELFIKQVRRGRPGRVSTELTREGLPVKKEEENG